jgi:hypothetical protein
MLHVIYRSYGGENKKGRPDYYSKRLALASFLRSFHAVASDKELIFLNDGPIPEDRLHLMQRYGDIVAGENMRLEGSFRAALTMPLSRRWKSGDLVWLAEDDYLYAVDAMTNLVAAQQTFPDADYFSLYSLIGDRQPNGEYPEDDRIPKAWQGSDLVRVGAHPWRRALSTTSTFGATVAALAGDGMMLRLGIKTGAAFDHTTCLAYHGFAPFPARHLVGMWRRPRSFRQLGFECARFGVRYAFNLYSVARTALGAKRRVLVTADPALITHMENGLLAVGTDWNAVAADSETWMRTVDGHATTMSQDAGVGLAS